MSRSDPRPAQAVARRRAIGRVAGAAIAAAALAAGCATPAPPPPAPAARAPVEGPRDWSGRFSVTLTAPSADRQDAAAGRFALTALPTPAGRSLALELTSPFGQTIATGERAPDGRSTLKLADGRTVEASTLDGVLERALGWPLPIERLPDWLDDRFEAVTSRDAQGRVTAATDSGWRIEREPLRWALQRIHGEGLLRVVLVLDR
jgi:outer membrane biogenesis lipoprotein LolB